jgi:hypothetical protein
VAQTEFTLARVEGFGATSAELRMVTDHISKHISSDHQIGEHDFITKELRPSPEVSAASASMTFDDH